MPPSTMIVWPVMKAASSLRRNMTRPTTQFSVARRPNGVRLDQIVQVPLDVAQNFRVAHRAVSTSFLVNSEDLLFA